MNSRASHGPEGSAPFGDGLFLLNIVTRTNLLILIFLLLIGQLTRGQGFMVITNANGTLTITGYNGSSGDIVIPESLNGMPVTGVATNAFQGNTNLTSVTISGEVSNIGAFAFLYCDTLTNLVLGEGITNVPSFMCFACTNLANVALPGTISRIDLAAFSGCASLKQITLLESIFGISRRQRNHARNPRNYDLNQHFQGFYQSASKTHGNALLLLHSVARFFAVVLCAPIQSSSSPAKTRLMTF